MVMDSSFSLSVDGVSLQRNDKIILDNVSFKVSKGSFTTIIGPNGAGKTTLLKAIIGLEKVDSGQIEFEPQAIIGYMPQKLEVNQLMPLRVRDFIKLSLKNTGCAHDGLYASLGIDQLLPKSMHSLSGGEFQRVLLARALSRHPTLLILDEPEQGLDITAQAALYQYLDGIKEGSNVTILMVSHDLHYVHGSSTDVICLNRHICCQGTPSDVQQDLEVRSLFPNFNYQPQAAMKPYVHRHNHTHDTVLTVSADQKEKWEATTNTSNSPKQKEPDQHG